MNNAFKLRKTTWLARLPTTEKAIETFRTMMTQRLEFLATISVVSLSSPTPTLVPLRDTILIEVFQDDYVNPGGFVALQ